MADNKVLIEVSVAGNAEIQFKKITSAVEDFSKKTEKGLFDASRAFDVFTGSLASQAVVGAFNALKNAANEVFNVFKEGVAAASEQEDAINELNRALKSSGEFSKQASTDLQSFASALQSTTKFSDEAVLSASAHLESLARLDRDGLKKATQASLDLAAALGIDLNSASTLVAKAAEGNITAFKRYGITIKEGKTDAETFANTLQKLNTQFGGAAANQVNTFSGALAQMKNQFGELLETLGQTITENPVVIATFKELSKIFAELNGASGSLKASISAFVSEGIIFLIEAAQATVPAVETVYAVLLRLQQAFVGTAAVISGVTNVLTLGLTDAGQRAEQSQEKFDELNEKIKNIGSNDGFSVVNDSLERLRATAQKASDDNISNLQKETEEIANQNQIRAELAAERQAKADEDAAKAESKRLEFNDKLVTELQTENENLTQIDKEMYAARIQQNNQWIDGLIQGNNVSAQKQIEIEKRRADQQRNIDKQLAQDRINVLNQIATLQTAKTKELQVIGKAAAISTATINTFAGVGQALAAYPPPFSFIMAALVAAAGAVNVANIAGVELATGITEVPAGFNNDTFPARLSSGERVISAPQNADLKAFMDDSSGVAERLDTLIELMGNQKRQTVVNVGGTELINIIQDEINSGKSLSL